MVLKINQTSNRPVLRVAVVPVKDIVDIIKSGDGQESVSGAEGAFLDTVLTALGYRYKLVIPTDREWGSMKDGNWTGMIGEVVRNRADLAWGFLSVSEDRQKAVDFSSSYFVEINTFAVVKPYPLPTANTIFYPFDLAVWICLLVVLIVMPVVLMFAKAKQTFVRLFLNVFSSILKQPLTVGNSSLKLRILLTAWLLFTTLVSSFYSSLLLSSLTKPLEQKPIKTFRELSDAVQKGDIECYSSRKTIVLPYLLHSSEEHMRILGETIKKNEWYVGIYIKHEPIRTTKNIAIINSELYLQIRNGMPGSRFLVISRDSLFTDNLAVAMRKDLCCKERINTMIIRAREAGLFDFYLRKFVYNTMVSENLDEEESKSLTVSDVSGTLFIFLLGISLSFLTFIAEFFFAKKKRIIVPQVMQENASKFF
ncbi:hypothetical protein AVEN_207451-1 [Araneus ventricosus]|uniref:Ionotropic glutamate receptor L-glutamate and glycine-binding domain-containing protein n=1 Tax=Araneus ventricosus TaxID=182803 RepID=A0A4Y2EA89_ARAVE|nr:hypothetical protein AVEN_207451-1 [Araneus ventricosus]